MAVLAVASSVLCWMRSLRRVGCSGICIGSGSVGSVFMGLTMGGTFRSFASCHRRCPGFMVASAYVIGGMFFLSSTLGGGAGIGSVSAASFAGTSFVGG